MSEELVQNIHKLQENILLNSFTQAIQTCQNIEIELEETLFFRGTFPFDLFKKNHLDFYSTYLFCLLRNHQYDEAKYLWKRAPEPLKQLNPSSSSASPTNNLFAWAWDLGKLFFTNQRSKAIQMIQSALSSSSGDLSEGTVILLQDLLDYHYQLFFFQLINAYQPITLSKAAQHLEMSEEHVRSVLNKVGYQVNESGELINESNSFQQAVLKEVVDKDVEALKSLAAYTNQLEREGLKVDLNAPAKEEKEKNTNNAPTTGKPHKGHK